ncbi:MAG TPA: hypothetical protein PLF56_00575 [Micropruina sp.]|nr:hypothetical protein [Micropruina sp.]
MTNKAGGECGSLADRASRTRNGGGNPNNANAHPRPQQAHAKPALPAHVTVTVIGTRCPGILLE